MYTSLIILSRIAGVLFILSFLYFSTDSIPFYFEDAPFIQQGLVQTYGQIFMNIANPFSVGNDFGGFSRPVELMFLKLIHGVDGYNPAIYHAFKSFCLLVVISFLAGWIFTITRSYFFSITCGAWIAVSAPIYQSSLWICDFEVVAQIFIIVSLFFWYSLLVKSYKPFQGILISLLIIGSAYIGSHTKGSALIIPITIFLSSLPFGLEKILHALYISAPIIIATAGVRFFMAENSLKSIFRPGNVPEFVLEIPWENLIFLLGFAAAVLILCDRLKVDDEQKRLKIKTTSAILMAWVISNLFLWLILPSSEARYLTPFLIPSIFMVCFVSSCFIPSIKGNSKLILAGLIPMIFLAIIYKNLVLDYHFRGFWGSNFIAMNKTIEFVNTSYENTLVLYEYWRPMLHSTEPSKNNLFLLSRKDELIKNKIKINDDGTIKVPERFSNALYLNFTQPIPNLKPIMEISGEDGGFFDKISKLNKSKVRPNSLMNLKIEDYETSYPAKVYIYGISRK